MNEVLKRRCPGLGYDGGKATRRFQRCAYLALPEDDTEVKDIITSICFQAVQMKESSPGATETVVKSFLTSIRINFTGQYASAAQRSAANYLPTSFKQVLTIMEDTGMCTWPTVYRYGMCECGFVYRGEHLRAQECPANEPGSDKSKICGKSRDPLKGVLYQTISQYIQRTYSNSKRASEFGAWQDRLAAAVDESKGGDPEALYDIGHGKAVKAVLDSNMAFREEPRNIIFIVITDPFIVSSSAWVC